MTTTTTITDLKRETPFTYREETNDRKIIEHIFEHNRYALPENLRGTTVIDLGAQIGSFSVLAALRGARVYAYEPEKENYALLEENTKGHTITCYNKAVGAKRGKQKLYIHPSNTGSNSIQLIEPDFSKEKYQEVEVVTFDDVIKDIDYCFFLKVDIEGAEVEILPRILEHHKKIKAVAMEVHDNMSIADTSVRDRLTAELVRQMDEAYGEKKIRSQHEFVWSQPV